MRSPATLKMLALEQLRHLIAEGELAPGDRLSDFSQSRRMGISRTPVREAINMLVAEGLAEAHPHAGVFVASPDREDLRELYELREALEGYAAAFLAARGEGPDIERLQACSDEAQALLATQANSGPLPGELWTRLRELDQGFHGIIVAGCGNRRIRRAMDDAAIHNRLFASLDGDMDLALQRLAWRMHADVLAAIRAGDEEAARQTMAAHIRTGRERRLALFASPNGNPSAAIS